MLWRLSNRSPTNWWVSSSRVRNRWRFSGGSRSPDASRPASSMSTLSGRSSRAAKTPAGPEPITMTSNNPVSPKQEAPLDVLEPGAEHGAAQREPGAHRPVGFVHQPRVMRGPRLGEVEQHPELPGQGRPRPPEHQLDRLDVEPPGHDRREEGRVRGVPAGMVVGPQVPPSEPGRGPLPEQRGVEVPGLLAQLAVAPDFGRGGKRHGGCASEGTRWGEK